MRTALLVAAIGLATSTSHALDYRLDARLDPVRHEVHGSGTITWTNTTRVAIDRLPFHVYLNAFRNEETTWLREAGNEHRGNPLETFGEVRVEKLVCGGRDVRTAARREESLLWVPLEPVAPGASVACEIEWTSVLPRVFARTGYLGDFHLVAQWFPKPAVLGSDGRLRGHAFHVSSEFFADYATFDVTIDVPSGFVVGATGRLEEESRALGRRKLRWRAERVHDFAWTASPHFSKIDSVVLGTRFRTLHYPAQTLVARRQHEVVRAALVHFSHAYGPYPYDTLTLVVPPPAAAGAGGMEYPTFITGSSRLWTPRGNFAPEVTAAHEFGHQYFYGLVGTNEFENAWMDEGLNSYATGRFMDRRYGPDRSTLGLGPLRVGQLAVSRLGTALAGTDEPLDTRAWEFASPRTYALHTYMHTDLALRTLRGIVGERAMERALRTYTMRRRFTHPTPDDLLADLSESLGRGPVDAVLRPVVRGGATVDYAVESVTSTERVAPRGIFDRDGGTVTVLDAGPIEPTAWETTVVVTRKGTIEAPVDVRIVFEDGRTVREHWSGRGPWARFTLRSSAAAASAEVDPDRRIALDSDWRNNGRGRSAGGAPRVLARAWYVVATLLQLVGP